MSVQACRGVQRAQREPRATPCGGARDGAHPGGLCCWDSSAGGWGGAVTRRSAAGASPRSRWGVCVAAELAGACLSNRPDWPRDQCAGLRSHIARGQRAWRRQWGLGARSALLPGLAALQSACRRLQLGRGWRQEGCTGWRRHRRRQRRRAGAARRAFVPSSRAAGSLPHQRRSSCGSVLQLPLHAVAGRAGLAPLRSQPPPAPLPCLPRRSSRQEGCRATMSQCWVLTPPTARPRRCRSRPPPARWARCGVGPAGDERLLGRGHALPVACCLLPVAMLHMRCRAQPVSYSSPFPPTTRAGAALPAAPGLRGGGARLAPGRRPRPAGHVRPPLSMLACLLACLLAELCRGCRPAEANTAWLARAVGCNGAMLDALHVTPCKCHPPAPLTPPGRSSKAAGLAAPFHFKRAVDAMSGAAPAGGAAQAAAAALVLFGACRALAGLAKELQGPVFAPVSQVRRRGRLDLPFLLRVPFRCAAAWRVCCCLAPLASGACAADGRKTGAAVWGGRPRRCACARRRTALHEPAAPGCPSPQGTAHQPRPACVAAPPQDAGRRVAFYTLSHVLGLDLQFHLNRKTGGNG